jgi:polar amino acid transport system ATP-binding protein
MNFARQAASRVIFMDHGRIVEQGGPDEIFGAPREARTRDFLRSVLERKEMSPAVESTAPATGSDRDG